MHQNIALVGQNQPPHNSKAREHSVGLLSQYVPESVYEFSSANACEQHDISVLHVLVFSHDADREANQKFESSPR
jgi:hypothetical protein